MLHDSPRNRTSHFLRNIIDSVADPIFVKDEEHRLIEFNRAMCLLMGRPREEILGRTDYDFFPKHEADVFREMDSEVFASGKDNVNEESFTDAFEVTRTISTKKSVFTDQDGSKVLVGVIRDITELREAERSNLELSQRMATSAKFAALGEMAAGIAHEINTPLAIIQGLADELLDLAEDGEAGLDSLTRINGKISETVERVSRIITGLRAFARGGGKDAPVETTQGHLVAETLALCGENLKVRGIEVRVIDGAHDVTVCCRPTQIVQILLNLLNNARDAVSDADERLIEVRTSCDERHGIVSVVDSGRGIPEDLRERVMEPFFTTKPVGTGTGIGLSIARSLAQDNGGSLTLDPEHERTCFELRMPRATVGS